MYICSNSRVSGAAQSAAHWFRALQQTILSVRKQEAKDFKLQYLFFKKSIPPCDYFYEAESSLHKDIFKRTNCPSTISSLTPIYEFLLLVFFWQFDNILIELKHSLRLFNGRPRQIRKGLSSLGRPFKNYGTNCQYYFAKILLICPQVYGRRG